MFCVVKLYCNQRLFPLPLYGLQPLCPLWPLTPDFNKVFSTTQLLEQLTGYFLFLRPFHINRRDGCASLKIPADQPCERSRTSPSGTSKQALFESPHFPVLMLALNFSTTPSPHLHAWAAAMRLAGELFLWTGKWSIYLTKWLMNGNTATNTAAPSSVSKTIASRTALPAPTVCSAYGAVIRHYYVACLQHLLQFGLFLGHCIVSTRQQWLK